MLISAKGKERGDLFGNSVTGGGIPIGNLPSNLQILHLDFMDGADSFLQGSLTISTTVDFQ